MSTSPRVEICITVDVEFSIGGAFTWPDRFEPLGRPVVDCHVGSRSQGLGFLLETFARHSIKATFFVEALNTAWFGDEPMGGIAAEIHGAGHDVQLHIHPCWRTFRDRQWRQHVRVNKPNDRCADRSVPEILDLIDEGLRTFARWGLPRPVALRVGNFETSRNVNRAIRDAGLTAGSNVCLGVYRPHDDTLASRGGRLNVEGTLELPIFNFVARHPSGLDWIDRPLAITNASWPEIKHVLWAAHRERSPPVLALAHPFDFVKTRNFRFENLRKNRIHQGRLTKLCRLISKRSDAFEAVTIGERHRSWLVNDTIPAPTIQVPTWMSMGRAITNFANGRLWLM